MIEGLKPLYNAVLRPAAGLFIRLGIRPNHITIAGTVIFCIAGYCAGIGRWHWALILVILGAFMDGWDGIVAREGGFSSTFGAILDSTCDRITEIAIFLGILVYYLYHPLGSGWGTWLSFIAMSGSLMVSYVKARCEAEGLRCKGGILQRPERIIIICIGLLAGPEVMVWMLLVMSVFGWYTVVERLVTAGIQNRNKAE
jgi:CDP-diacylglycerol---glycerol-3-phosphate 3-phosphatidyltransferase